MKDHCITSSQNSVSFSQNLVIFPLGVDEDIDQVSGLKTLI